MVFKYKKGDKIENSCPDYCLERSKHFSRNDGGYGIGGIMKAVQEVEHQRREDESGNEQECGWRKIHDKVSVLWV